MKRDERKEVISRITNNNVLGQGRKLRYQGKTEDFLIFDIPLNALIYNVENGRIASWVKSYAKQNRVLDPEKPEDAAQIAQFIYLSSEAANKKTREHIAECGQLEPGIITADGVIVDGNRRASLMLSILNDPSATPDQKARCEKFRTVVLPQNATQKDILRLETTYQLGTDEKVGYNVIEKYLHARDLEENGFSVGEIQAFMGETKSSVQEMLEMVSLIDEYLESCDCTGIYTNLPSGWEDDLLKLNTAVKKIKKGGVPWIPQDKLKRVENDLKAVSFDYVRLNMKQDDGFDFRAIASTANANFLGNENIWNKFINRWQEAIEDVEEETLEDVLEKAGSSEADFRRLLKARDQVWRSKVKEELRDSFADAKDKIENIKREEKPSALLRKAYNALDGVNLSVVYSLKEDEKREMGLQLRDILKLVDKISEVINKNNQ